MRLVVQQGEHELTGVVRAEESWAAAARRTCAALHVEPVPVDLSTETKRFTIDHDHHVALRAMTRGDLPEVLRWRQQDHVRPWWVSDGEPTLEAVTAKYGPDIDGTSATRMWVLEVNGRSVGFIEDYRIGDYPEYALLGPDPDAIGIDYMIGEPAWVGRGIGLLMIWAWMARARTRFPEARSVFSAPDHRNHPSIRVLRKAGFTEALWFDEPQSDGTVRTLVGHTLDVRTVIG